MDYNQLPTILARYSFEEKMLICARNSRIIMDVVSGMAGYEIIKNKALPWELETFLMFSIRFKEWKNDDFKEKRQKKFVEIINCIKDFQHSAIISQSHSFRPDLFMVVTALTQFNIQEFIPYTLYRYNYYFNFKNNDIDMPKEFLNKFGCSYSYFLKFGYGLHFLFASQATIPWDIINYMCQKIYFVMKELTLSRHEYIERLDQSTNGIADYLYCLRPSYTYPFISDKGKSFLPLPHLLIRSITTSLLYRLTEENDGLNITIGKEVAEKYLLEIINKSRIFDEVYPEFEYKDGKSTNKTIDVMTRKDNDYVFFDSKSTRPSLGIRVFNQDNIDSNVDVLAKSCFQMYKHLREKFPQKYNPFQIYSDIIKEENLWGIVVVLEDSYVMREKIYEKAAKKLEIRLGSKEYEWLSLHICIVSLYEIERCCFVGENIIEHLRKHVENDRCNDFLFANGLENKTLINQDVSGFQNQLCSYIDGLIKELVQE